VTWYAEGNKLDQEIFDALTELVGLAMRRGEEISEQFGVPGVCVKAMHRLDASIAMKELGKRMHCDPSFVTAIADTLEKRGLARREPNPADRRIKNLVLTPEGLELKGQLEEALLRQMPWCHALDQQERETLLMLIHKMINAEAARTQPGTRERAGEVSDVLSTASRA
jgi:MarR family transcriptional regulator, organic hydroperoxide resistance regulator